MPVDLLISNAYVVDGSGGPGRFADVAVDDHRIVAIGRPRSGPLARRRIDAGGRVLAPGFIDLHAHSDLQILLDPGHTAKVSQGVTCELLGQDGLSFAPVDPSTRETVRRLTAGWNGDGGGVENEWSTV